MECNFLLIAVTLLKQKSRRQNIKQKVKTCSDFIKRTLLKKCVLNGFAESLIEESKEGPSS